MSSITEVLWVCTYHRTYLPYILCVHYIACVHMYVQYVEGVRRCTKVYEGVRRYVYMCTYTKVDKKLQIFKIDYKIEKSYG